MQPIVMLERKDLDDLIAKAAAAQPSVGYCPEWLTVSQVAQALGITDGAVRDRCRKGQLKTEPGARPWMIHRSEVE